MDIIKEMIFNKDIFLFGAGSSLLLADFAIDMQSVWPILSGLVFLSVWIWRQIREDNRKEEQHDHDEQRAENEEIRRQEKHEKNMRGN
jgi:membrane protein implicated in regulation of membrane protease activity